MCVNGAGTGMGLSRRPRRRPALVLARAASIAVARGASMRPTVPCPTGTTAARIYATTTTSVFVLFVPVLKKQKKKITRFFKSRLRAAKKKNSPSGRADKKGAVRPARIFFATGSLIALGTPPKLHL